MKQGDLTINIKKVKLRIVISVSSKLNIIFLSSSWMLPLLLNAAAVAGSGHCSWMLHLLLNTAAAAGSGNCSWMLPPLVIVFCLLITAVC